MPEVFYWCRGQDDNIGDVLLRRRLLRELRTLGRVHVLIGHASPSFVESMKFKDSERLYQSRLQWLTALYRTVLRHDVVIAANPGEVRVGTKSATAYSLVLPAQLLSGARGGKSIQSGVAIRGRHPIFSIPIEHFGNRADVRSYRALTSGISTACITPDWAFDERDHRLPTSFARNRCAVTFRSDRPQLPRSSTDAIRAVCAERGLEIVVFSQVRRDNDRSLKLGEALDGEVLIWKDDVSHLEQEHKVRDLMARSEVVISDRIHALIMGTSEGATPLGLIPGNDGKVGPHFAAAGVHDISRNVLPLDFDSVKEMFDRTLQRRSEIERQVNIARGRIVGLGERIRSLAPQKSAMMGD